MFNKNKTEKNGLSIIIVGCGKVGATLVQQLSMEGHDITVIDKNPERIQNITNLYDVMGLVGNGASFSTQLEAGISKADLIIAVTGSDELNLLCCTLAKQVGDNCAAIARVRTPDYSEEVNYLREKLGLAMIINPELEAAREAARILYLPTALEVNSFAHGQAELVKFKIPEGNKIDGITIANLGQNITNDILICAVERDNEVYIPTGDFKLSAGDVISFVAQRYYARKFLTTIGLATKRVKDTLIVGGSKAAYYLAKELINVGIDVKIIEQDKKRCEILSVLLPKAIIINGDGTNPDILKEEGIATAESFIALTGIDEENILLTLHVRQVSKAKVITKINRIGFKEVINRLDLGSLVYPKYITSEAIIAYVRAKKNSMGSNIETLYHMFDQRVEAIEFIVEESSKVTGVPLRDLKLKKNVLISFINRNGQIIIPTGNDSILIGDTVMIVTKHFGFNDLKEIAE
ncbi:MAG: Trk system potassium transporter TrkA [Lachnospira sp.]